LKNQFRSLDEDEVDFLDSVLESTRAREKEVKQKTAEELEAFRRQREEAEKAVTREGVTEAPPESHEIWNVGPRKRKKGKETAGIGGIKIRRTSTNDGEKPLTIRGDAEAESPPIAPLKALANENFARGTASKLSPTPADESKPGTAPASPPAIPLLGLGAYSSDEDG